VDIPPYVSQFIQSLFLSGAILLVYYKFWLENPLYAGGIVFAFLLRWLFPVEKTFQYIILTLCAAAWTYWGVYKAEKFIVLHPHLPVAFVATAGILWIGLTKLNR